MARVLVPLPDRDFDTTEVAVPWHVLTHAGHEVVFATERGRTAPACDPRLIDGVIFGQLGAAGDAKSCYGRLTENEEFAHPIAWSAIVPSDFDALMLAGGHAPGMRQYLGSDALAETVLAFVATGRPFGAICHGPVVLARARDAATGHSVLHGRRTTCLPKSMERSAYFLTAWKLGRYYRTYPEYVEDEVRGALASPDQFVRGPRTLGLRRGTETDDRAAFVVEDANYVSARWPGDSWLFAKRLLDRL